MTARPTLLAVSAATLASLASLAPAVAAPGDAAVRRCVRDNLPRYSSPDRALVSQYFDLDQACRAALAGDGTSRIWITPLGSRPAAASPRPAAPSGGSGAPTTPAPTLARPPRTGGGQTTGARPADASAVVARALKKAGRGASVPGSGPNLMAAPAALIVLGGGMALAVAAAAGRRAWRRRR